MLQVKPIYFLIFCSCLMGTSCTVHPVGAFRSDAVPEVPDYSDPEAWAALPFRLDSADVVPDTSLANKQDEAVADVFFIHPTTYIGRRGQRAWNAEISDPDLMIRTDRGTIRNQATVFNGSCRVYAPRYRQAHLECFYTKRREDAQKALDLAYRDVRAAFEYYLDHYNEKRPLVIAAHSQGTRHAAHLIRDFYNNESEMPPLIVAYLVGMPVKENQFENLGPCQSAEDYNCFCSWRTVHEKYRPNKFYPVGDEYVATNPLSWESSSGVVIREAHHGAVLRKFYDGLYDGFVDAWSDNGLLRISPPKIPGMLVVPMRNYHIADYNFFYANIRGNVKDRIVAFLDNSEVQVR